MEAVRIFIEAKSRALEQVVQEGLAHVLGQLAGSINKTRSACRARL